MAVFGIFEVIYLQEFHFEQFVTSCKASIRPAREKECLEELYPYKTKYKPTVESGRSIFMIHSISTYSQASSSFLVSLGATL